MVRPSKQTTGMATDQQITAMFRAGRRDDAAELCVRAYHVRILSFLTRTLNNTEAGKEAFADFSAAVWTKRHEYDPDTNLRKWVYTCARSARRKRYRSWARYRARYSGRDHELLGSHSSQNLDKEFERVESYSMLANLWMRLSEADRELLTLYHDDDMTSGDVGEILGISGVAVRARYQRLKTKLRSLHEKVTESSQKCPTV